MNGAAEVLVIILSVVLALFLLLVIVLTILLIRITKQIKAITGSAERTIQSVEAATTHMSKAATPALMLKLLTTIVKKSVTVSKRKKAKEDSHVKRK